VQQAALTVQVEKLPFLDAIASDQRVKEKLSKKEIDALKDLGYHMKHEEYIYKKVGI
jgi:adenylosuccinate lyase